MVEAKFEVDANAVRAVLLEGRTLFDVARELGISELKLRSWVRWAEEGMQESDTFLAVLNEMAELQKEKRELLAQRQQLRNELALKRVWRNQTAVESD